VAESAKHRSNASRSGTIAFAASSRQHRYAEQYDDRLLFMNTYWIDCHAYESAKKGLSARNLTPEVAGMVDVFSRSPLKDICEHDKGARKYAR
jgi:hypothetical protein